MLSLCLINIDDFSCRKFLITNLNASRRDFPVRNCQEFFGAIPDCSPHPAARAAFREDARETTRPDDHPAFTTHSAYLQHEGKTATWAGNSPAIIQRHYKGLVKVGDTQDFWSITPESMENKIILLSSKRAA